MRRADIATAIALAASLGVNVYLYERPPAVTHAAPRTKRTVVVGPSPAALLPRDIDTTRPCADQLDEVESRLTEVATELGQALTPKDRFEDDDAVPAPELEAETKPLVDRLFADAPAAMKYSVTCRDRVCRIWITAGKGNYRWDERLQAPDFRSRWGAVMFYGTQAFLERRDE